MGDNISIDGLDVRPVRSIRDRRVLDAMNETTGWAVLGNDTLNLATDDNNILGNKSLIFDKVNGAGNTVVAGIEKTLTKPIDLSEYLSEDELSFAFFATALTDIVSITVRIGTDASNFSVFTVLVADLTADVWNHIKFPLSEVDGANKVGTGHDLSVISYIAVAVNFTLETNALAGLTFDHLLVQSANN